MISNLKMPEEVFRLFIKPFLNNLKKQIYTEIDNALNRELNIGYYVMISFLGILILGYLFIWLPFQYSLSDHIKRTRNMLEIIPNTLVSDLEKEIN